MNVDLTLAERPQTMRDAWRATMQARRRDRIYLGLTGLAFALGILDSVTSQTLAVVPAMCMMHAAGTANGLAGRRASRHFGAPLRDWQPQTLLGRLLGVVTLSAVFSALLLSTAALVVDTDESAVGFGITALSGVAWIVSLVFVLSTFLPRRLDAVVAVVLFPLGSLLYRDRTQFTNTTLANAVEAAWQNFGPLSVSDALLSTAAWVDVARWASNITLAIIAGLLITYLRRDKSAVGPQPRRWLRMLAMASTLAIAARLVIPSLEDQVTWIDFRASNGRVESVASGTSGRPTLYNFTADWCAICARLDRDLFAERADAQWINERFVPVRVLDREREEGRNTETVDQLQKRFEVTGFPTLVVVGPDGNVLSRVVGYSGNLTEVRSKLGTTLTGATAQPR